MNTPENIISPECGARPNTAGTPSTQGCSAPATKEGKSDFSKHPCFSRDAHHKYGRIHLPIAPRCNIQCNFCNRKYDCINESRPGVTSVVLSPVQALHYLSDTIAKRPEIAVAGIAGPGDPFANAPETMETLRLVHAHFPKMLLCVATNGLNIGPYIDELADLRVSHVTLTITAVDPKIAAQIYAWVREDKRPIRGVEAAELLIQRQIEALVRLKAAGITVKINSIIVPGVNDDHIPEVAERVAGLGADIMNCVPLVPVQGAVFEAVPTPDNIMIARTRLTCGLHLPQMSHCARCRADAVGLIAETMTPEQISTLNHYATMNPNAGDTESRPYVAVASMEGALVNQHLGEAERVLIYEPNPDQKDAFRLKEIRPAPPAGGGDSRWTELGRLLNDCRAFLVMAAGPSPMKALTQTGLRVVEMEGLIEEGLSAVYAGQPVPSTIKRQFNGCSMGITCKGTGTGCG